MWFDEIWKLTRAEAAQQRTAFAAQTGAWPSESGKRAATCLPHRWERGGGGGRVREGEQKASATAAVAAAAAATTAATCSLACSLASLLACFGRPLSVRAPLVGGSSSWDGAGDVQSRRRRVTDWSRPVPA